MEGPRAGVFARRSRYLDCWVLVGLASGKVINVAFPSSAPEVESEEVPPVLDGLLAYLDEGERPNLRDVEIGLTVPTEERRIFETVREIPYGSAWSVTTVADRSALPERDETAVARVRDALTGNPMPILVPDHRVDGVTGSPPAAVRRALREREGIA